MPNSLGRRESGQSRYKGFNDMTPSQDKDFKTKCNGDHLHTMSHNETMDAVI